MWLFLLTAFAVALAVPAQAAATPDPTALAKGAVAHGMRDPASAQFRNVRVADRCSGITYVNGWANGKNGFGGYAGLMIFLVRVANGQAEVMQAYGRVFATDAEFHTAAACTGG